MLFSKTLSLVASAVAVCASAIPAPVRARGSISVTPHDRYSSSAGVLGCKIDTNRVAYWPSNVDCDNLCVKVSANGRTVHLLKVDTSGGAHDISYDAWNYLVTGKSARDAPTVGGGIDATWENAPLSDCAHLINEPKGRLALSAANGMNFYGTCDNTKTALYNIANPVCTRGYDEVCTLAAGANQATCPHTLGSLDALTSQPVWNIDYGTGKLSLAV
ncbi:hypothetical protein F4813DRAFT_391521 [Daldinia decipiens]|uniref:uncharacterized protein n=1 Tax=Daldinia decipiens TaxID=326647 RepID=UPI0020C33BC3|nr:uncharacterized protein F4813DRAFT_391521 [Daldinia decipiens]KAI1655671.1 hypothetical protein F4813DRAFT_391521 [Daldinia decipiens]